MGAVQLAGVPLCCVDFEVDHGKKRQVLRWSAYHTPASHALLAIDGAFDGGSQPLLVYMLMQCVRLGCRTLAPLC